MMGNTESVIETALNEQNIIHEGEPSISRAELAIQHRAWYMIAVIENISWLLLEPC